MVFTNPWGLLALLAIPLIVGLHFFRDRRRIQRIGGLHLWQFARTSLPVGRRLDRLVRNLPLLFQLLAALLAALLIAGFDLPREDTRRHYAIILDDSASMQAGTPGAATTPGARDSAAARARPLIKKWAKKDDRFTLIAAGLKPRIIAGAFATRDELFSALDAWQPAEAGCDAQAALTLAAKFLAGDEKILFVTDDETPLKAAAAHLEIAALGAPRENVAITFADRLRAAPDRDRIVVTVCAYSSTAKNVQLQAAVQGQAFQTQQVSLEAAKPLSVSFETRELARPIEITIEPDALAADNRAVLAPVAVKTVKAAVLTLGEATDSFTRALRALPNTVVTDSVTEADLVFTAARDYAPAPRNRRLGLLPYLPDLAAAKIQPRLAEGRAILIDQRAPAVAGLSLEGVLWPFAPVTTATTSAGQALLSSQGQPLLTQETLGARRTNWRFNLFWDRSNIFRQAAWPILVQGLVEDCREAIPGLSRANWRLGENIPLNLDPDPKLPRRFELRRDGAAYAKYDAPPELLAGLPAGGYDLIQEGAQPPGAALARFQVNFFAPGESDLRAVNPRTADFAQLVSTAVRKTQTNKALFLGLVLMILFFTALSWVFQDISG